MTVKKIKVGSTEHNIYADAIKVTDTTPTSATTYYPLYSTGKSDYQTVRANADLYYYDTGSSGYFNIGSSSQLGGLSLHQTNGYCANLVPDSLTANRDIKLPNKSGTIALTSDVSSFNDRLFVTLVPTGTAVPQNADLNSTTYLKVGRYYCSQDIVVQTLTNCPTTKAFMMEIYSPLTTTIDNETSTWVYRLRKITTYTGEEYIQSCYVAGTAGTWNYGAWQQTVKTPLSSLKIGGATLSYDENADALKITFA